MNLSDWLFVAAAIGGLLALVLAVGALRRPRARLLRWLGVLLLLGLAIPLGGLGLLLRHYHWLVDDQPVATIALKQLSPQRYAATLVPAGKPAMERELLGDEWQLDARVVRWQLPVLLAGVPPVYRLERLSGRYGDPKEELSKPRSVYDLRDRWDFWQFQQRQASWLHLADARWGSAAYLPMLDGATYRVAINPRGGLVATPADAKTEALLRASGW
ncbi:MAG: hypothetical protein ABI588_02300 [Arenimonas sp.]